MEIRVERSTDPQENSGSWTFPATIVIGVLVVGGLGYFGYTQFRAADAESFKRLNIPMSDYNDAQIYKLSPIVKDYTADYCDPASKIALVDKVRSAGFVELAARLATDHYNRCAKDARFLMIASDNYTELGQYTKALEITERLIQYDPANYSIRFRRGKIYEAMKRFDKALVDYTSTLALLGRPEHVAVSQFYEIASMYAALGKFCEAATPLETYIAFDYVKRRDPQILHLIEEYRAKGNCAQPIQNSNSYVRAQKSGAVLLVKGTVNGVAGTFILDTGASLVSVTRTFAEKAKIPLDPENQTTFATANGITTGILATADSIQLGSEFSTHIPISVMEDKKLRSGDSDQIVGLMGMSFLSRFDVVVKADGVELRSKF